MLKTAHFVQFFCNSIIRAYVYIVKAFAEIYRILFISMSISGITTDILQIHINFRCYLTIFYDNCKFSCVLYEITLVSVRFQKKSEKFSCNDDGKNENPLRRGAAHTFPPPLLAFFYFLKYTAPFCAIIKRTIIYPYFDFSYKICYNIYRK